MIYKPHVRVVNETVKCSHLIMEFRVHSLYFLWQMHVTYALYLTHPNSDCKGVTKTSQSLRKTPRGRVGDWDSCVLESSWNVMAHSDAREGKWRGNWRMEWVASTLHTNPEHGVSSITTADAQTSAASSRLNWRPRRFKWTRPFRRKTKSGFCGGAITFQTQSNTSDRTRTNDCQHLK